MHRYLKTPVIATALALSSVVAYSSQAGATIRSFARVSPAENEAKAASYLDVYDAGSPGEYSGEYARYSLPDLSLLSTTQATGIASPIAFDKGVPYFVDEAEKTSGFAVYQQPLEGGVVAAVQQFPGVPCQSTSLAIGPGGDDYVVQYCSASVLEFKGGTSKHGQPKKPIKVFTGGNLGKAEPTAAAIDKHGNLYVGDTGGGVTFFAADSTQAVVALPTGNGQSVTQIVVDAAGSVYSIHLADATGVHFSDDTHCVVDPSGPVTRYNLAERFSGSKFSQELYSAPSDSAFAASEGVSIAVDDRQRVYTGAFAVDGPSVVLEYAPRAGCPDLGLALTLPGGANPQIAVDAQRRYYVTDAVDNQITVYKGATKTKIKTITQPTGLVAPTYAAIP
jgi:hypothetical protein